MNLASLTLPAKVAAAVMLVGAGILAGMLIDSEPDPPSVDAGLPGAIAVEPEAPPAPTADAARPEPVAAPRWRTFEGELQPDQTLTASLQAHGITAVQVHELVAALKGIYDFRTARPGAAYTLRLRNQDQRIEQFRFVHGPLDEFEVARSPNDRLAGRRVEIPVRVVPASVGAEIHGSLYATMQGLGEQPGLVSLIVDVFAWDIDFFRDTQPGDQFRVIVEKIYKEDQLIRYGRVLAAEYRGQIGTFRTFWFTPGAQADQEAPGDYYLEDGRSARKSFLRTPLKFVRVSSRFSKNRKHPILGYRRAHLGVDYAAPRGTPVWAMSRGSVRFAGRKGGYGKLVIIDHHNGLQSYYAHLHRIGRGIKRGVRVDQKRVIGQVGATGTATGPHLHFGVKRGGRFINPQRLKMTRGKPVARSHRAAFEGVVKKRIEALAAIPVGPTQTPPAPATPDAGSPSDPQAATP